MEKENFNYIKNVISNNDLKRKAKEYSKNKIDLDTKFKIGKFVYLMEKESEEIAIKRYASKLSKEFGKEYNYTNLQKMKSFYILTKNKKINKENFTWNHFLLLQDLEDKFDYYIDLINNENISINKLKDIIKGYKYNFKNIKKDEKVFSKLLFEDIELLLNNLGCYYSFIKSDYKIKINDNEENIDLLLYNIKFRSYVAIIIKNNMKKEYENKIKEYQKYLNKNLKTFLDNNSIGVILINKNGKYKVEYSNNDEILNKKYIILE